MVLHAWQCGTLSPGNRLGDSGAAAPPLRTGNATPSAGPGLYRGFTEQTTSVCLGTRWGGELRGSGDAPSVTGSRAPALFIIVIARWKNRLIWRRSTNVLPTLMPTLPLREIMCKLCRNPENHFIMVLICSVQLLSRRLSKPGMSGCHTSATGDYWKVSADAVQSIWGGALHCLTRSCWVVLFPPFSL